MGIYYALSAFSLAALCFSLLKEGRGYATTRASATDRDLILYRGAVCVMFTVLILVLWFLTGFRASDIGNDTATYLRAFQVNRVELNNDSRMDLGFKIICNMVGWLTDSGNVFLLLVASVSYAALYVAVLKNSDNPLFSLCLILTTCFSPMTNLLRQSIAAIISIFAVLSYERGRRILFFVMVAIAMTIHMSALVLLLLPIVCKFSGRSVWVSLAVGVLLSVLSVAGLLGPLLALITPERFNNYYFGSRSETGQLGTLIGAATAFARYALIKYAYEGTGEGRIPVGLALLSAVIAPLGFTTNIFSRVDLYPDFAMVILLPKAIYRGRIKHKELVTLVVCVFEVALFLAMLILRPEWNHLYPWHSWLWQ